MSKKLYLEHSDFVQAAELLGVDVPAIKAVAEVESRGRGFQDDGQPIILFERHLFHRFTKGVWSAKNPDISNASPGGYGSSSSQHARLQKAAALNRDAALRAASWGQFQILGDNWKLTGHRDLQHFINDMYAGVDMHLLAFVQFLHSTGLDKKLRAHDWAGFARGYNGPGYAKNAYDKKLAQAWKKHGGK